MRLQLHALAYNLGNFLRTLALPDAVNHWSLTTLRDRLIKTGGKIVRHGRYVTFQMAEVAIPRNLFADILHRIDLLRPKPTLARLARLFHHSMADTRPAIDRLNLPAPVRYKLITPETDLNHNFRVGRISHGGCLLRNAPI